MTLLSGLKRLSGSFRRMSTGGDTPLLESELAFLPSNTLDYLRQGKSVLIPTQKDFYGVVLFVDISGFTAFGEDLKSQYVPNLAAEKLSSILLLLNCWTRICLDWGGDVSKFAGDALMCIWSVPVSDEEMIGFNEHGDVPGELRIMEMMAQAAGHEMIIKTKQVMAEHEIEIKGLHGIICSGKLSQVFLTNSDGTSRWSFIIGDPLDNIDEMIQDCDQGEIHAYLSFHKDGYLTIDRLFQPVVQKPESLKEPLKIYKSIPKGYVVSFIPPLVRLRLQINSSLGNSELRTVSTVFIKMPLEHFTVASGIDLVKLNTVFERMSTFIRQGDGELRDLLFDDKGFICIAVFGAYKFQEEAEQSAVRASYDIREHVEECSIGIATGSCIVGLCGDKTQRHDLVVIGSDVTLASRFCDAAATGEIVVDLSTYRKNTLDYSFKSKSVARKYKGMPYEGYIVESKLRRTLQKFGESGASSRALPLGSKFVGQISTQLEVCQEFLLSLGNIAHPSSGILVVTGCYGVGKSAMVHQLLKICQLRNIQLQGDSLEIHNMYFAIKQLIENLTGLEMAKSDLERESILIELEDSGIIIPEIARYHVLKYLPHSYEPGFEDEKGILSSNLTQLCSDLLRRNLAHCVVLENFHYFDKESIDILRGLISTVISASSAYIFILTSIPWSNQDGNRFEYAKRAQEKILKTSEAKSAGVEIEVLDPASARVLVKRRFKEEIGGFRTIDPELLEFVECNTSGIPLNIIETVKHLHRQRFVAVGQDSVLVFSSKDKEHEANQNPLAINLKVFENILNSLSEKEKKFLKIACCMAEMPGIGSATGLEKNYLVFDAEMVTKVFRLDTELLEKELKIILGKLEIDRFIGRVLHVSKTSKFPILRRWSSSRSAWFRFPSSPSFAAVSKLLPQGERVRTINKIKSIWQDSAKDLISKVEEQFC